MSEPESTDITEADFTTARPSRTLRPRGPPWGRRSQPMFDHLLGIAADPPPRFQPLADAPAGDVLAAQVATADWLEELGVPSDEEIDSRLQRTAAREAFNEIVVEPDATDESKKLALAQIKTPEAVRHLVGMLSAYDWEFVNQAKELRGYVVAQILEETKHPDAKVRLKALQMLGNVTEISAFTTRVEVVQPKVSEEELNERLKEKLKAFLDQTVVAEQAPLLPGEDKQQ